VLSDGIVVQISTKPGESFIDRMIAWWKEPVARRPPRDRPQHPPRRVTIIFLLAVVTLQPFAHYSNATQSITVLVPCWSAHPDHHRRPSFGHTVSPGMDRLVQRNVLAMSGRAVEAAGDVSTLLLDRQERSPTQPPCRRVPAASGSR